MAKFEGNEYTAFGTAMHYVCENVVENNELTEPDLQNIFMKKILMNINHQEYYLVFQE